MKKIYLIIFILSLIASNINNVKAEDECSSYSDKSSYELYIQRVNCICKEYKSNENIVNIKKEYPKIISEEEMQEIVWPLQKDIENIQKELKDANIPKNKYEYETCSAEVFDNYSEMTKCLENQKAEVEKNAENNTKRLEFENKINDKVNEIAEKTNWLTDKYSLDNTKEMHRYNMNTIYKCWLLSTQKKSLLLIKDDLIKKSPTMWKKIEGRINSEVSKIDNLSNTLNCTNSKNKSSVQKLILLKQATYQTCKYISYLEYLKEYSRDIKNNLPKDKTEFTPNEIIKLEVEKLTELDDEIANTYKVFPLVFHAYTEYENNITAHFLLELLKDDYLTLREKIDQTLNPINQVVYKVVNAMKK